MLLLARIRSRGNASRIAVVVVVVLRTLTAGGLQAHRRLLSIRETDSIRPQFEHLLSACLLLMIERRLASPIDSLNIASILHSLLLLRT